MGVKNVYPSSESASKTCTLKQKVGFEASKTCTLRQKVREKRVPSARKSGARRRTKPHTRPCIFRIRRIPNPRDKDLVLVKLATPYPIPAYFWPCLIRPLHLPGALLSARPKGALRISARLIGGGWLYSESMSLS